MPKYRVDTEGGSYIVETEDVAAPPVAAPAPAPSALERVGGVARNVLEGAGSGVLSTIYHGGDLIRRATGQESIIDRPDVQALIRPPEGRGGGTGRFLEQAAEFAVPMGTAARVVKGAPAAARVATDALLSGGIAGVQTGGDTGAMAGATVAGGAAAGAGAVLPKVAGALRASAERGYGQVLAATKQGNKWLSKNKAVPELLERRVRAWSLTKLGAKTAANLNRVGQAIGDEWDNLPAGTSVELDPIMARISQASDEALTVATLRGPVPMGSIAQGGMDTAQSLNATLRNVAEVNQKTGVLEVPVERLRKLRQFWDTIAAKSGRYEGKPLADQSTAEAHGLAADAIREELGRAFPDIAKLNKEYSFWKSVNKIVTDTLQRKEGQAKPLGKKLAGAVGMGAGFAGGGVHGAVLGKAAMEGLETLTTSPAWRTVTAVWKNDLANAIASGNRGKIEWLIQRALKPGAAAGSANVLSRPSGSPGLVPSP